MLKQGAQMIVQEFNGLLPQDTEQLLKIPGIGPYTAGAIASIAFGKRAAIVDGNVIRVVSRLRGIRAPANDRAGNKLIWALAQDIVPEENPGNFNQGLMELGATVCMPKVAQCDSCPVREICIAYKEVAESKRPIKYEDNKETCELCQAEGDEDIESVTRYPLKKQRARQREQLSLVWILSATNESDELVYLLIKRPKEKQTNKLLINQWEFPSLELDLDDSEEEPEDHKKHLDKLRKNLLQYMLDVGIIQNKSDISQKSAEMSSFVHIFSHIRRTAYIECQQIPYLASSRISCESCWGTKSSLSERGLNTFVSKCLKSMTSSNSQSRITRFFKK
jgi:A/G-specific adenine glycosylase